MTIDGLIECLESLHSMFPSHMAEGKKTRDQSKEFHSGQFENTYHRHKENRYETLTSFQQKSQNVL